MKNTIPTTDPTRRRVRRLYRSVKRADWFPNEVDKLIDLVEQGYSYAVIAKRLKRTHTAVMVKVKRLPRGHRVTTTNNTMSGRDVAKLLGLGCSKTVTYWIHLGWLKARNAGTPGRAIWRITHDDLLSMLENQDTWMAWHPSLITEPCLREWACELRANTSPWLPIGDVAKRLGIGHAAVNDWIHRELLPAMRYGNWWIRESSLIGFRIPSDQPYRQDCFKANGNPLKLIALLTTTPQSSADLAAQLGASARVTQQALRSLVRRGLAVRHDLRPVAWSQP